MSADVSPTLWRSAKRASLVGAIALVVSLVGLWFDPRGFWQAYYIAWLFVTGIAAGCLVNVALHEVTGGPWGLVLRAPLEAGMATLPLAAILAIPLAFALPDIFPWIHPASPELDTVVRAKAWWLNVPFFLGRAIAILAIWCVLGAALRRHALRRMRGEIVHRALPTAGVMAYFVTVTIAAIDWMGSLVPEWYSTAIGLRVGVSQSLGAFAFAVPVAFLIARAERLPPASRPRDLQDLGNLLLTFAMTWAYIAYTEFLIVWAEDLPHETSWFWPRASTSWRFVVYVLFALEFALPVFAMLFRAVKTRRGALGMVCTLVAIGQWLDVEWWIAPSLRPQGFAIGWMDVTMTVALAAFGLAWGTLALHRHPDALNVARREVLHA